MDSLDIAVCVLGLILVLRELAIRASKPSPAEREIQHQRRAMRDRN
jgi:hypothetical protein